MALGHDGDNEDQNVRAGLDYWEAVPASIDGVLGKSRRVRGIYIYILLIFEGTIGGFGNGVRPSVQIQLRQHSYIWGCGNVVFYLCGKAFASRGCVGLASIPLGTDAFIMYCSLRSPQTGAVVAAHETRTSS
jgi:hypothetical protein